MGSTPLLGAAQAGHSEVATCQLEYSLLIRLVFCQKLLAACRAPYCKFSVSEVRFLCQAQALRLPGSSLDIAKVYTPTRRI